MDDAYQFLIVWIAAVIFFAVIIFRVATKKSVPAPARIEGWAKKSGVLILTAERRLFLKGPFWAQRGGAVYRVRVRDSRQEERDGWLRLQYALFGQDSEEIRWSRPNKNA